MRVKYVSQRRQFGWANKIRNCLCLFPFITAHGKLKIISRWEWRQREREIIFHFSIHLSIIHIPLIHPHSFTCSAWEGRRKCCEGENCCLFLLIFHFTDSRRENGAHTKNTDREDVKNICNFSHVHSTNLSPINETQNSTSRVCMPTNWVNLLRQQWKTTWKTNYLHKTPSLRSVAQRHCRT